MLVVKHEATNHYNVVPTRNGYGVTGPGLGPHLDELSDLSLPVAQALSRYLMRAFMAGADGRSEQLRLLLGAKS